MIYKIWELKLYRAYSDWEINGRKTEKNVIDVEQPLSDCFMKIITNFLWKHTGIYIYSVWMSPNNEPYFQLYNFAPRRRLIKVFNNLKYKCCLFYVLLLIWLLKKGLKPKGIT